MIRELLVLVDERAARVAGNALGTEHVVNAPTDVLSSRLTALAPPGVLLRTGLELAEDVVPAVAIESVRHPLTLFRQEAGVLQVPFPVFQVDFLVCDVDSRRRSECRGRSPAVFPCAFQKRPESDTWPSCRSSLELPDGKYTET